MTTDVRDFLRPAEPSVCSTQSLEAALQAMFRADSEHVVVRDMRGCPIGVITREDIRTFKAALPTAWSQRRCAQAVVSMPAVLRPEDSPKACVQYYRDHGIRPLVIFDGKEPVGLLHPTEVFQWCAQQDAALVEELAAQARSPLQHQSRYAHQSQRRRRSDTAPAGGPA